MKEHKQTQAAIYRQHSLNRIIELEAVLHGETLTPEQATERAINRYEDFLEDVTVDEIIVAYSNGKKVVNLSIHK